MLEYLPKPKEHPIAVPKMVKKEYSAFRKLISKANDNGYFLLMLPKLLDEIMNFEFVHQSLFEQTMDKIDKVKYLFLNFLCS